MTRVLVAASVVLLSLRGASAHRLDEYLQATTISLEKDRVEGEIRLTPGVAVLGFVLAGIDTDGDGVISAVEQRAYAERVLQDLSLKVGGERLGLRLTSVKFPGMQEIKEGLGEIQLGFVADIRDSGRERKLVFENHHCSRIAAYLVNCLVPRDPGIRVTGQNRNYEQSVYQLEYSLRPGPSAGWWWLTSWVWIAVLAVLLVARLAVLLWRQGRNYRLLGEPF